MKRPSAQDCTALAELRTATPLGEIFARCGGIDLPGLPVVLVHGLVVSSRYMVPTAERLAPFRPVYAPDLPGFGRSAKPKKTLTVSELAGALRAFLAGNRLGRVCLVANSLGCQIAAELAARYPSFVERMVFLGPTVDCRARSFWPQLWRQLKNGPWEERGLFGVLCADYRAAGLRRTLATVRETLKDRIEERLPRLAMPVPVLRGGNDTVCPQRWAEEVVRLLPKGELRVVPGGGHVLNYSHPREVVQAVLEFSER